MSTRYNQRGMTAIGWLLVLGLIGCFTLVTLRLVPLYLEYYKVVAVLEGLEGKKSIVDKSNAEINEIALKTLEGHVRGVCATMTIEAINSDRDTISQKIQKMAAQDLMNMGIEITGIKDNTPIPHNGCRPKKRKGR